MPVTQTSELLTTMLGELAVEGVLSTTVFPDDVDTVLLLLDTVLDTVDDVTVSTAQALVENKITTVTANSFLNISASLVYFISPA
tara:strand:- start:1061 stop:1315 length:255 start_codon:yes stop_codon:yes gene_type:complete